MVKEEKAHYLFRTDPAEKWRTQNSGVVALPSDTERIVAVQGNQFLGLSVKTAGQFGKAIKKITAERQPSKETYWLKMYQIVQDTDSGLKITEEMMQTKVQAFLKQKENN